MTPPRPADAGTAQAEGGAGKTVEKISPVEDHQEPENGAGGNGAGGNGAGGDGVGDEEGFDPGVAAAAGGTGSARLDLEAVEDTGERITLRVYRGDASAGEYVNYEVPFVPGMVVLDAVHRIQEEQASDLACRWNCKAGKCGSCSAEVNGIPRLLCMTRMADVDTSGPVTVAPIRAFPVQRDLVPDVSWNYEVKKRIKPFTPREMTLEEAEKGEFKMKQIDVERSQEFRKCIECFLCQNACHVLRTHELHHAFQGPRYLIRYAELEMNPADEGGRLDDAWDKGGIGYCNITKCCTDVCPENIQITDNAIIPVKERIVAHRFDPLAKLWRVVTGKAK